MPCEGLPVEAEPMAMDVMPCHGCGTQCAVAWEGFKPDWVYCRACRSKRGWSKKPQGHAVFEIAAD